MNELHRELEQLRTRFQRFHEYRDQDGAWMRLMRRQTPTRLQAGLQDKQQGIDYQSPIAADALRKFVKVLQLNPTRIDGRVQGADTKEAREAERAIILSLAQGWTQMNPGRWVDAAVGEGQSALGIKVMRLCYQPQVEPDADSDEARDKAYRARKWPFYFENTLIDGCFWLQDEQGVNVFYYEYSKPLIDCDIRRKSGDSYEKPTLVGNKVGWVGAHEEYDKSTGEKRIKIIVRDAVTDEDCPVEGCNHKLREITTYVCPENGGADDYEKVESVISPFERSSFHVIGAEESFIQTDPHDKYFAPMLPIFVELAWLNYTETLIATMARADYDDDGFYFIKDPQAVQAFDALSEGGYIPSFPMPREGEVLELPAEVRRFPKTLSPHLMTLRQEIMKRIESFLPNRYMLGEAYNQASNATATVFLQQAQQAALQFNGMLVASDVFIQNALMDCLHAIKYWGYAYEKDPPRYYGTVSGKTNARYAREYAGKEVFIDANIAAHPFVLEIKTQNMTTAEKGARWTQIYSQYRAGFATEEQVFEEIDVYDPIGQYEQLQRSYARRDVQPVIRAIESAYAIKQASLMSGVDIQALMSGTLGQEEAPAAGIGDPANGRMPGLPANNLTGGFMQTPAVATAEGGSSPL